MKWLRANIDNPTLWAVLVMAAIFLASLGGCAFVREIPATSSPVRTHRYYQTQDVPNVVGGAVAGQALSLVVRGPYKCGEWGHYCGTMAPFARIGMVGALGLVRRHTDRGYRESGALMNMAGAMVGEWVRLVIFGIQKNRDARP